MILLLEWQEAPENLCVSRLVQIWVSKSLCFWATKLLKFYPYKVIVEQQPFSWGWEGRSWYYTCLTEVVAIRFHDPEPVCFSYEAWFTLSGNVNRRMTDFCALEVPHMVHKVCMNIRVEVWCADSVRKSLVSLFSKKWYFPATVSTQFWHHSLDDLQKKKKYSYFMQDSGKAHLVKFSVAALDEVFSSWVISYGVVASQISRFGWV
jgi:hypothetical protein